MVSHLGPLRNYLKKNNVCNTKHEYLYSVTITVIFVYLVQKEVQFLLT
jgi:hypothetical protein